MKGDAAVIHVCEALASGILRVVPALADETVVAGMPTVVVYGRRPETPEDMSEWFDPRVRLVPVDGWGDRSAVGGCVGTVRAAVAARLARRHGVSVVQNGVDGELAEPGVALAGEGFVVASVGRAAYQRRPDLFVEMRALLGEDGDTAFHWFGDGPDRELLVRAGVAVSGWLAQRDAAAAIARTDVLVHFSAFEGLPLSLLEAMWAGRAVVASDLPAIREVVDDAGILVRDAAEAADAVRRLRGDAGLRAELAARAHDRAQRLFTRRAMVKRTLAAYGL